MEFAAKPFSTRQKLRNDSAQASTAPADVAEPHRIEPMIQ
jgi:hypothetical protein